MGVAAGDAVSIDLRVNQLLSQLPYNSRNKIAATIMSMSEPYLTAFEEHLSHNKNKLQAYLGILIGLSTCDDYELERLEEECHVINIFDLADRIIDYKEKGRPVYETNRS